MAGIPIKALPDGVLRVAQVLRDKGHAHAPVLLDEAARTAQQAADALGVALGQIAKSIVFKRKPDAMAVLVITSGDRRVDEARVQALVCAQGQKLGRADADFVKAATGFSIGGVSPVGHTGPVLTLIDRDLLRFHEIWAAAGHPHAVFKLHPNDLVPLTGAALADIALQVTP
ncbi:Cys-tRNA(Pro)/Cys-tRNA(Cys) deacylase YbaK [mine drainage metagenome]|uniref:Cys-tRNA(Pro)/Cys-tRNA(Cys) deacylase YbaK n=1 Tax=mine drainage metagenome TaxID=410659 RepID=A0A1J5P8Z6_9ZZZZ